MEKHARKNASRAGLPSAPQPSSPGVPGFPCVVVALAASLTLAACGGGGGGGVGQLSLAASKSSRTTAVGDSAGASVAGSAQDASYAVAAVSAINAHKSGFRGSGVRIAVVDSGVDVEHPDLVEAFDWSGVSNRQNGNPKGRNFVTNPDNDLNNVRPRARAKSSASWIDVPARRMSHGTHVSGIIAARDNNIGVVGIAPEASLLPIRWLSDGQPERYKFAEDKDPADAVFDDYIREFTEVVNYASRNGSFVMNNSWGTNWRPRVVEIDLPAGEKGYFLQPRVVKLGYAAFTAALFREELRTAIKRSVENEDGIVFVFAAGNDGWNSETGEVEVFKQKFTGEDIHKYLNSGERIDPQFLRANAPQFSRASTPSNLPSPLSSAFIGNPELKGMWLSVVATDKANRITPFSNGCGEAAEYCLAAPGAFIRSTIFSEDGDFNTYLTETDYGQYQGTSMAAPVVSSALAVLKSRFRNLDAKQAVDTLLRTATDLGAPGTDPVYGHGLVNLARALEPIGSVNAAGGHGRGVAASADTRIAFSSAFGNAAPSARHLFGGFDSFGRVYRYKAPLQDRVMPGPRLAGVLALNGAEGPVKLGGGDGTTALLRHSTTPESTIGDGTAVTFIGARHRTDLSIAARKTSSVLSPAALMSPATEDRPALGPVWQGFAPSAREVISGETEWQVGKGVRAGAYFSRAQGDGATRRNERYGLTDFGVSAQIDKKAGGVGLRLGRLNEQGRFLGSKSEGGYALARPTRSDYLHLSAERRLSSRLSVGANVMQLRAHVDFRHDGFVRDAEVRARSAGVHLAFDDAARTGDRLVVHYGEPLAVTGGTIRQSSIMGYTRAGAYRAEDSVLDLGVRKRHRMAQVMYRTPLADGISGFAAAAHHRNWSHQGGLGNNLLMVGLSVRR